MGQVSSSYHNLCLTPTSIIIEELNIQWFKTVMLPLKSLCTRSQLLMTKDTEWTILINRCNCGWEHIKWLLLTAWITDCTCSFYFFDGCILRFLKVLFSFVLFYSLTLLAAIVSYELHAFKSNRWLNCPFSTRHVLKHLWLWLVCWWCFTRFSCLVALWPKVKKTRPTLN